MYSKMLMGINRLNLVKSDHKLIILANILVKKCVSKIIVHSLYIRKSTKLNCFYQVVGVACFEMSIIKI